MAGFLSGKELEDLIQKNIEPEERFLSASTQELLDQHFVPRLHGYTVKPGKVSDSIFGGKGSYVDKRNGNVIQFENRPLQNKDGLPLRIMVRTDRISTHDINRGTIPFKDQVLAINHHFMRNLLRDVYQFGASQFDLSGLGETSVVIAAENLQTLPVEMVLRRFMAKSSTKTSLYHAYAVEGKREFCGHQLPEGLIANGPLPYLIDTPSTKSEEHDESVAPEELYQRGICTKEQYLQLKNSCQLAFGKVWNFLESAFSTSPMTGGRKQVEKAGSKETDGQFPFDGEQRQGKKIILVDTKTEHGINCKGELVSQDELYTLDSSRFWLKEEYDEQWKKYQKGEIPCPEPEQLSKEYARKFSMGDQIYTPEQRIQIAVRYVESIQFLLGKPFVPDLRSREERIISGLKTIVEELVA